MGQFPQQPANLNSQNQFELRNGDDKTIGEFAIHGDKLTMQAEAGEQIEGDLRIDHANQFTFTVDGNSMVFIRS